MADCLKRLLGICCDPCCGEQAEPWEEVTALAVSGRNVVTPKGVVQVHAGNVPLPGQTVLMTKSGRTAGSRPQRRARTSNRDEVVFSQPPPSYDTPQRPGFWGLMADGSRED